MSLFALTISVISLIERQRNDERLGDGQTPEETDSAVHAPDSNASARDSDHKRPETHSWRESRRAPDEPVSLPWFLCGFASAVGYRHLSDHDVWSIRRSRVRRIGFGALEMLSGLLLARYDENASHSFGIGSCEGTVVYRLKYGLLNEPPGE